VLAAMALELACSPWTDELRLTLVDDGRLSPALAQHNVQTAHDVDALLERLEQTDRDRRAHGRGSDARDLRLDPDLGEAWTPEVVLVDVALTADQTERLSSLTTGQPGAGLTVVVRGLAGAPATLALDADGRATLLPGGVRLVPQTLPAAGFDPVVELVAATGSEETQPAPWWSSTDPPGPPPDNVTYLGRRRKTDERDELERRAAVQARITEAADGSARGRTDSSGRSTANRRAISRWLPWRRSGRVCSRGRADLKRRRWPGRVKTATARMANTARKMTTFGEAAIERIWPA
jgi:hypothetical protein